MAVTLELWADPENDAESSCCSASAVAQARAWPTAWVWPISPIDLRDEFRAGVVEPFIAGYAGGEHPTRAWAATATCVWTPCSRWPTAGAPAPGHGPLRPGGRGRASPAPCSARPPIRPRIRPTCWPRWPASLARMRFPLGELHKPEVRGIAAEAGLPVAGKADSQDLCFLAGTSRPRFLARHGAWATARGAGRPDGRSSARHLGQHRFTVGSAGASGWPAAEPCSCSTRSREWPGRRSGPRAACGLSAWRARGAPAPRGGPGGPGQAPLPLTGRPGGWPGIRPLARHRRWTSSLRAGGRCRPGPAGLPDGRGPRGRVGHHHPPDRVVGRPGRGPRTTGCAPRTTAGGGPANVCAHHSAG